jgi:filamentous hemagglutinin
MPIFYTIGGKIRKQMTKRGWTEELIEDTLNNPDKTNFVRDTRYRPDGNRMNEPATVYIRSDSNYVIRNDITGDIVQISDCNNPNWKSPFNDI